MLIKYLFVVFVFIANLISPSPMLASERDVADIFKTTQSSLNQEDPSFQDVNGYRNFEFKESLDKAFIFNAVPIKEPLEAASDSLQHNNLKSIREKASEG